MNIGALSSTTLDTTLEQAKLAKKTEELNKFKEVIDKVQDSTLNGVEEISYEEDKKLKEMCKEFEHYFIKEMFKSMKKTVNYSEFMGGHSQAEEIFQDMLDDKYAEGAAENGSFGLAKMMYNQMKTQNGTTKIDD